MWDSNKKRENLTAQNAEIVELLLSAGAIVMGKTSTSELAYLEPTKNYQSSMIIQEHQEALQVDQLLQLLH